ncbi:MAG: hypothetical protein JNN05_09660, partial [Candidatus Omnitrophica bacterium]|nr:hypothetical protein [Candidatus Omnitrophota bacterium]
MNTETMTIAKTILEQMGGNRFAIMTGAKNFVALGSVLMFSLPSRFAKDGINKIEIKLNVMDTYDVKFYKVAKFDAVTIASFEQVYAEDLQT